MAIERKWSTGKSIRFALLASKRLLIFGRLSNPQTTCLSLGVLIVDFVEETSDAALVEELDGTGGAVTLFGYDDLGFAPLLGLGVVIFVPVDEGDQVGVLLDGS